MHETKRMKPIYDEMVKLERELNAAKAEIERLKSKSCDFCNETPQTENEKLFLEKYGDAPASEISSTDVWRKLLNLKFEDVKQP